MMPLLSSIFFSSFTSPLSVFLSKPNSFVTYFHINTHTLSHSHKYTRTHRNTGSHIHTQTHIHTRKHTHIDLHRQIHTQIYALTHTYTYTYTHILTLSLIQNTNTQTHTHKYTHIYTIRLDSFVELSKMSKDVPDDTPLLAALALRFEAGNLLSFFLLIEVN